MKIKELLTYTREMVPNVFPDWLLLDWLNELEGRIQLDIWLREPKDVMKYRLPEDEEKELLLTAADSGVYRSWMKAMVYRANGDYSKYQNEMERFNTGWSEYACRYLEQQVQERSE